MWEMWDRKATYVITWIRQDTGSIMRETFSCKITDFDKEILKRSAGMHGWAFRFELV